MLKELQFKKRERQFIDKIINRFKKYYTTAEMEIILGSIDHNNNKIIADELQKFVGIYDTTKTYTKQLIKNYIDSLFIYFFEQNRFSKYINTAIEKEIKLNILENINFYNTIFDKNYEISDNLKTVKYKGREFKIIKFINYILNCEGKFKNVNIDLEKIYEIQKINLLKGGTEEKIIITNNVKEFLMMSSYSNTFTSCMCLDSHYKENKRLLSNIKDVGSLLIYITNGNKIEPTSCNDAFRNATRKLGEDVYKGYDMQARAILRMFYEKESKQFYIGIDRIYGEDTESISFFKMIDLIVKLMEGTNLKYIDLYTHFEYDYTKDFGKKLCLYHTEKERSLYFCMRPYYDYTFERHNYNEEKHINVFEKYVYTQSKLKQTLDNKLKGKNNE
jgi:hypothetical protein